MPSKEKVLVDELLAKTASGAITWEPTAKEGEFVVTFGGGVTVSISEDPTSGGPGYLLSVGERDRGEVFTLHYGSNDVSSDTLPGLYEQARRNAFKVDKTLDLILNQLKAKA